MTDIADKGVIALGDSEAMMRLHALLAPAALAAALATSSADAAQINVNFSGVLTEATSADFGPEFPKRAFAAGQTFSGSFGFDTDSLAWVGLPRIVNAFRFSIPEQDFEIDFAPVGGLAYRGPDGLYYFTAGRASFSRDAQIALNLPTETGQYPSEAELNGVTGTFRFAAYGPGGGTGFGVVTLGSSVPESSTWAMMVVGIGAAGYWMRRRRRPTPIAT